jgi:hypothetical protein
VSYRHLVLFRVREQVPDHELQAVVERTRAVLAAAPGVVSAYVRPSLDARKGRVVVEDVTFADGAAYDAFRGSREHEGITAAWAAMADWVVGDYVIDEAATHEARGDAEA